MKLFVAFSVLLSGVSSFSFLQKPPARQSKVISQPFSSRRITIEQTFCSIQKPFIVKLYATSKEVTDSDGIDAIQQLFNKHCDKDGLMTKSTLAAMLPFSEMLAEKDLTMEELNDIWNTAPKFPDVAGEDTRIDVDSFVQIYRDVDDLFEDEGDAEEGDETETFANAPSPNLDTNAQENDDIQLEDENVEAELEQVFETLCDSAKLMSKDMLKEWDEIEKLLAEGLLGEDEFDEIWSKTSKSPGSEELMLDVDGFLSFNVALDALFEFDDEEDEEIETESPPPVARTIVQGEDLPPGLIFSQLANENFLVGIDDLKYWGDLQDMLQEGDLLQSEVENLFNEVKKSDSRKVDEDGFITLYERIDALFEDDDGEMEESKIDVEKAQDIKEDLMSFIDIIIEEEALPCGLDCNEKDQKQVLNIVQALEQQKSNFIAAKNGNIDLSDLAGTWELLYSSSAAMKFNQGLSGLGGSVPNGKFGGLKQKLMASKYLTDIEYKERIDVTPSSASFDVTVNGNWDIRSSVSLFTGQPSIILDIEPDRVTYGPTSTRADHWKSLGPLNMLDLTYLDEDFRIMRGCTSSDTVFIYKRVDSEK